MKRERIPDHIRDAIAEARRNGELIKVVAHRFGVSMSTVVAICDHHGVKRVPKWRQIVDYAAAHKAASPDAIAERFDTTRRSVEVILSEHGMARGLITLGREAHRAGLSIQDIRAIAQQRGGA